MENGKNIADLVFYGNTLADWGAALLALLITLVWMRTVQSYGLRDLKALALRTRLPWADLVFESLEKTKFIVLLLIAAYAASLMLVLPERVQTVVRTAAIIAFLLQAAFWVSGFLHGWLDRYRERQLKANPAAATSIGAIGFILKLALWVCAGLLILDNLGVDITALVAGLGIGGIAVALAVQNILGDLFASLTIVMDKPFVVGDFLNVGTEMGTVEYIGLKTTRLRSLSGEQIVLSNSDLLSSRIRNYGRMYERRLEVNISVSYDTPRDKLRMIPQILREAVAAQPKVRFDRAHFKSYSPASLDFQYVYFVLAADYNTYMDINQNINFAIHERFEAEGISFARPAPSVVVQPPAAVKAKAA